MSEPTQTCVVCGDVEIVRPCGRGFPPDVAKRRLVKRCRTSGHSPVVVYLAGLSSTIEAILARGNGDAA